MPFGDLVIEQRITQAIIDLMALRSNLNKLKALLPHGAFFCPMVKANAYGHGADRVAEVCESVGVSALGVALYSEAFHLRSSGVQAPILVFEPGANYPTDRLESDHLIPVVSSFYDLEKLVGVSCQIHLKFNTGMNRLGFSIREIPRILDFVNVNKGIHLEGVCSHLSHGHDVGLEEGQSARQIERFEEIERRLSPHASCFHLWNTSGLLALNARGEKQKKWGARPGIGIYGGYTGLSIDDPMVANFASTLDLVPVMSLKAKIAQSYVIRKGEIVSYGGTWKANRDSVVAALSFGYADGFSRHFSNRAKLSWRGKPVPVIGRVCMDYTMIDMTDLTSDPTEVLGDDVFVFGKASESQPLAERAAKVVNTIPYELFTSVSPRVPRKYVGS